MNVRAYREADLEAVASVFTRSVHALAAEHYSPAQCRAWAPQPPDLDYWRERLRPLTMLVAERGDQLAGFIGYESDGHIDLLFTSPDHARCGVASVLYQQVESSFRAAAVDQMFTEASLAARPFFERHGFRVVQPQQVTLRGHSFRRFAMSKTLGGPTRTSPQLI